MEDLKKWYRGGLATRLNALRAAQRELDHDSSAIDSIRRIAHTLRGSGTTYGFPQVSETAGAVEDANPEEFNSHLKILLQTLEEVSSFGALDEKVGILIIDDDPYISDLLRSLLENSQREIFIAPTAAEAEALLEEKKVSLILLDLVLPDTDGRNFLMHLKESSGTSSIPVIVLSAKLGAQPKTECFALGADAYFEKPFEIDTISAAVSAQLQRTEINMRESRSDNLTGLPNRAAFKEAFGRQSSLALRKGESLSVGILDLDRFKFINDTYGHGMGDDVLRRTAKIVGATLRKSDLLARWGGEEFVMLLPNTDAEGASNAVRKALEALREERFTGPGDKFFQVTFSAGIAELKEGESVDDIIAEADRFLYLAKSQGRNRVFTAKDKAPIVSKTIMLAADDETVVAIVKNRLGREGFQISHFAEAGLALAACMQEQFSVCIVDVKVPKMGGIELLTQLRASAAMSKTPIILLTSAGKEKEVAKGFELGADDYLVKPFSPFELLARIRNVLRRA